MLKPEQETYLAKMHFRLTNIISHLGQESTVISTVWSHQQILAQARGLRDIAQGWEQRL